MKSPFTEEFLRMSRRQAFMRGLIRGGAVAILVAAIGGLAVLLAWAVLGNLDVAVLQIWDSFLFIVREIGKAWRGH